MSVGHAPPPFDEVRASALPPTSAPPLRAVPPRECGPDSGGSETGGLRAGQLPPTSQLLISGCSNRAPTLRCTGMRRQILGEFFGRVWLSEAKGQTPGLLEAIARCLQAPRDLRHARSLLRRFREVDAVLRGAAARAAGSGEELLAICRRGGLSGSGAPSGPTRLSAAEGGLEGFFADPNVDSVLLGSSLDFKFLVRLDSVLCSKLCNTIRTRI